MKLTSTAPILVIGLLAASLLPMPAAQPNADQFLHQMSAKLASAKQLSFQAEREIDPALLEGRSVPEKARVDVRVSRPNRLAARSVSKEDARRFIADGQNLTVVDEKKNFYAQVPMRTSIDGLVTQLDENYGFVPPLADFAVSDPYAEIRQQSQTIASVGREKVSGVECEHFALKGKEADADLWIGVSDHLPRKLVATFHRAGRPQLRVAFSNWNLAAPVTASDFTFNPPHGAQKIEMWTKAQMQAQAAATKQQPKSNR
jgi:hypothetical protein